MARTRQVKPDFFLHEELHRADTVSALPCRLSYIGLWQQSDRRGLFEWKPGRLKLAILPFDNVDFEQVLNTLEEFGFVFSYVVAGRKYGWCPTMGRHQHFHKDERINALIPEPPEELKHRVSTVQAPGQHGVSTPAIYLSASGLRHTASAIAGTVSAPAEPDADGQTDDDFARALTATANSALREKIGPTAAAIPEKRATTLVTFLRAEKIPLAFACHSIIRQVAESVTEPVGTLSYFRKGISQDWEARNAPPPNGTHGKPRRSNRDDRPRANLGSAPVRPEDEGIVCFTCRSRETHVVSGRVKPKHKDGCPLGDAVAKVAK